LELAELLHQTELGVQAALHLLERTALLLAVAAALVRVEVEEAALEAPVLVGT
jgi:hypothetical protein